MENSVKNDELFTVEVQEDGKIIDFLGGQLLVARPEELVRQKFLRILHFEYKYPKNRLAREVPIFYGGKEFLDADGRPVRADIAIYANASACKKRDQGKIEIVIECKSPTIAEGHNQLVSYVFNTSANGAAWFNDTDDIRYFRRFSSPQQKLVDWIGLPRCDQTWDSLGMVKKSNLARPKDIKGLLRRCHNKLHGRGHDSEETDLTMDMVRIILAKAKDEEIPGDSPLFYCTAEEYSSESGQRAVADRVQELFSEVVHDNPTVFVSGEKITVGALSICDVVCELQGYKLLSNLYESNDWDIMGHAYEQYTASYLKRQQGQFFTNRLVTDFMVSMLDPDYQDIILDPAGGSGGFLTAVMRYVRKKILNRTSTDIAKQRQLDQHRTRLFMIEINKRLVKIAKTAMILNGDGHAGMTYGDSLGGYGKLNEEVRAKAGQGRPTLILTNPPFAGVGEGRITDEKILSSFSCGMKWTERGGKYEILGVNDDGVPPEMLFFERCLDWVAPGGKIGIVMPKSFLDTMTYYTARRLLLNKFKVLAIVNCHKNTFQPHTGVRTCLLFIEKPKEGELLPPDYSIFMAVSRKIGQDSEGVPIFRRNENNEETNEIDSDLDDILKDWESFKNGLLKESEYRFKVKRSEIAGPSGLNPQFYLPELNKTIKEIESIDGLEGWTVTSLGQAAKGIHIFKGPRIKTENLVVEDRSKATDLYYTPSSILQEKNDSVKFLDINLAKEKQIRFFNILKVRRGDLLITRSGTIGRVAFVTKRLDGAIVSDDMIRVRIPDEYLRNYIYMFLQSASGMNQMLRNEYGSVQQHLEAKHISGILLPIPDDVGKIKPIVDQVEAAITAREALEASHDSAQKNMTDLISHLLVEVKQ